MFDEKITLNNKQFVLQCLTIIIVNISPLFG